jgi:hypothetical protein
MGARRIVAIDVMSSMPRSLRWPATAVRAALRLDLQPPRDVEVLVLSPGRLLGGWQEAACWQSESANRWLAEGEREGTRRSEEIRSYLAGRSLSVQSTEAN